METAVAYYKDGVPYDDKGQVIITLLNGTPDGSALAAEVEKEAVKVKVLQLFMQLLNGLLLN
ncbi:hypothetical protein B5H79_004264 [Shigella boydii]|nr:hypothetical protein [Shigella boydii]EFY9946956.1 hypothetical protein [Shigella boydii]EFZ3804102.1 hypothetical protein [Shigella boydii]